MAKKKTSSPLSILLFVLTMIMVATAIFYYISKPKFVRYPAFGIDIPVNYSIHGIDVSHHQSNIDWEDVKAMQIKNISINFCFIKATEGVDNEDDKFGYNWRAARKNRVTRGAYHFFIAGKSGKEQAGNFIQSVQLKTGDLPPVLDVESIGAATKADLQKRVAEWLEVVESYYGVKPIIYTNADFYKQYLEGKFDDYPLWVAHYFVKDKPRIKREWTFWQHNEAGRVNGINAYVDFNVFNGDSTAFKNLLIK